MVLPCCLVICCCSVFGVRSVWMGFNCCLYYWWPRASHQADQLPFFFPAQSVLKIIPGRRNVSTPREFPECIEIALFFWGGLFCFALGGCTISQSLLFVYKRLKVHFHRLQMQHPPSELGGEFF